MQWQFFSTRASWRAALRMTFPITCLVSTLVSCGTQQLNTGAPGEPPGAQKQPITTGVATQALEGPGVYTVSMPISHDTMVMPRRPTANYGRYSYLGVGLTDGAVGLAGVDATALAHTIGDRVVQEAQLTFNLAGLTRDVRVNAHYVTRTWNQGRATWRCAGTPPVNARGSGASAGSAATVCRQHDDWCLDRAQPNCTPPWHAIPTAQTTLTRDDDSSETARFDVTADVQAWLDNHRQDPTAAAGAAEGQMVSWLLARDSSYSQGSAYFHTSESWWHPTPTLVLTLADPCLPAVCSELGQQTCGHQPDGCGGMLDCGPCCQPATCATIGANCGAHADGCGGSVDCGSCCTPQDCTAINASCGSHPDGCGGTMDCGSCCRSQTCDDLGVTCGSHPDGCGGTVDCGPACPTGGGAGTGNGGSGEEGGTGTGSGTGTNNGGTCVAESCPTQSTEPGWLRTEGNQILTSDGQVWQARGATVHDTRSCWACSWMPPHPGEVLRRIDTLVDDWGANFIRLAMESHNLNDSVLANKEYLGHLQEIVAHIGTKPGVYVMLSLWVDPSIRAADNDNGIVGGWPTNDTVRVWEVLAETFVNDPHVIFSIVNEPEANWSGTHDAEVWRRMNKVVAGIRAVEADAGTPSHLIAVQGTRAWARRLDYYVNVPIASCDGSNIVYETHVYDRHYTPGTGFVCQVGETCDWFDILFEGPSKTLPVVIGEFGPAGGMTLEDTLELMESAESRNIPYLAWTFHGRCPPNLLVDNTRHEDVPAEYRGCGVDMPLVPTEGWGEQVYCRFQQPWGASADAGQDCLQ